MVNIVHIGLAVDKLNQIFNNLNNVFFGQDPDAHIDIEIQFPVDAETANFSQVVTLVREEQLVDNIASGCLVRWFCVAQLPVDVKHCLFFRVAGVFL